MSWIVKLKVLPFLLKFPRFILMVAQNISRRIIFLTYALKRLPKEQTRLKTL